MILCYLNLSSTYSSLVPIQINVIILHFSSFQVWPVQLYNVQPNEHKIFETVSNNLGDLQNFL